MSFFRITRIQKVGDSLAALIPKGVCDALRLRRGDTILVKLLDENTIVITKVNVIK